MASRRNVNFRIGAQDDTARGTRSAASNFKRLGRTASVALGTFASNTVTSAIGALRSSLSSVLDQFDRAQKLGQILDIDAAVVRRIQLVGDLIGSSGENLARLAQRVRGVAQAGSKAQQEALESLGLNLQEIAKSDAATVLLEIGRAAKVAGTQAEGALGEAVGTRLAATAVLLSKNLPDAAREFTRDLDEDLNAAADATASFNDALRVLQQGVQNTGAKAFATLQRAAGASKNEIIAFARALGEEAPKINPFTGALLPLINAFKKTGEEAKKAGSEAKESALAMFGFSEAPNEGRIILAALAKEEEARAEKRKKKKKEEDDAEKKAAAERAAEAREHYDTIIEGLQAVIDLEEKRRNANRAGGFGELGRDARIPGAAPSGAASQAQRLLDAETQRKQLAAQQAMLKELRKGTRTEFG